jgi:hypothetical protein
MDISSGRDASKTRDTNSSDTHYNVLTAEIARAQDMRTLRGKSILGIN